MYTSISGSGRPSLGVCSLDYAGELHKRGIQRVKVRLRGGGDASARGDFRVPFPGDTLASCEPWKRGVTNVSFFLSFFFSQYWNKISSQRLTDRFLFTGNWSFRKEFQRLKDRFPFFPSLLSLSFPFTFLLCLSLFLFFSSSFHPTFLSSFSDFSVFIREETLKDFYLLILRSKVCFHFLEKLKAYSVLCYYVMFHHVMVKVHSWIHFSTESSCFISYDVRVE